ncbi:MAG: host-nuclease inhibitor Gam family protein [Sulfurimonas sp.]|uniref:host-nuclease inhibitor Gam family protein n=1 Tax=Sulfurimonas sp. TaxID=2022749 RepID=UPI003D0AD2EB
MAKEKRSKPSIETVKITSLSEADGLLKRISDINANLRKIEADADIRVNEIKEEMKAQAEELIEEKEGLEKSLGIYSEYNKSELFSDKKTIELTFGLFGYRQSTSISVKQTTLELLKKHGLEEAIITKESPSKEVMRDWSVEKLKLVDAKRVVEDKFWVEAKQNEVEV